MFQSKPFPIPVVPALGPGSQGDDEVADFMPMPRGMTTFSAPPLPEPEVFAAHGGARQVLHEACVALRRAAAGEACASIDLGVLDAADRAVINQVLGEGEVAVQLTGPDEVQVQESVFAGVWRVLQRDGETVVRDTIEVGPFPRAVVEAAQRDGAAMPALPAPLPADTMNAPAVLEELRSRSAAWREGDAVHVVNLSLLPLTPGDSELFERTLGRGRVVVLSRGYGNCRVVNTAVAAIWRVTYFNSQDMIILDTLEVGSVPEVACAARQDLEDSAERLAEVLQWVEAA